MTPSVDPPWKIHPPRGMVLIAATNLGDRSLRELLGPGIHLEILQFQNERTNPGLNFQNLNHWIPKPSPKKTCGEPVAADVRD